MPSFNQHYYQEHKKRGRSQANECPLAQVIEIFFQRYHIDYNPLQDRIVKEFSSLVGPYICKFITHTSVYKNILYIRVCSPIVKAELQMVCVALTNKINSNLNQKAINKIVVRS